MTFPALWSRRLGLQPPVPSEDHYLNQWAEERVRHRDTASELATAQRTVRDQAAEIARLVELVDKLTHASVNEDIAVSKALREHHAWHDCKRRATERDPEKGSGLKPTQNPPSGVGATPNVTGGCW